MAQGSRLVLPHVVVFSFPAQGHINPALQFSQLLASSLSLCTVTFVSTSSYIAKLRAANMDLPPCIRLCALSDDGKIQQGLDLFTGIEQMGGLLESLLVKLLQPKDGEAKEKDEDSACGMKHIGDVQTACADDGIEEEWHTSDSIENQKAKGNNVTTQTNDCECMYKENMTGDCDEWPPPVCIVSDLFLGWVQDVADKLNIPRFLLFSPSPATLVVMLSLPEMVSQGRLPCANVDDAHKQPLDLPGLSQTLRLADVPPHFLPGFMFDFYLRQSKRIPEAAAILVNSFYELQSSAVDAAQDLAGPFPAMWADLLQKHLQFRVIPVGPLLPSPGSNGRRNTQAAALRPSGPEDDVCLQWLDQHPPASVVYVSFGSVAEVTKEQIHELAWGLEASGKPFLWVLRGGNESLPQNMRMETVMADANPSGLSETTPAHLRRGMHTPKPNHLVVSWAPQLDVLAHPSTGFFLSHCGWNSTLEALCAGVPVLGWPVFADQNMNCKCLVDDLKVAMDFRKEEGGLVRKEEVERVVREVLETEHGSHLRRRALEWKLRSEAAVSDGGLSQENMKAFGSFLSSLGARSKT